MNRSEAEEVLRRLEDRADIEALMLRYCRHADLLDAEGMAACFTEDCVSYAPLPGRAALLAFLRDYLPATRSSAHHIGNLELRVDGADAATAHYAMHSWTRHQRHPAASDAVRFGRYELRAVRTAEGWRLSHLRLVTSGGYGGVPAGEQFGRPWPPRFD